MGFLLYFKGRLSGLALHVRAESKSYESAIKLSLRITGSHQASVTVIDAYSGAQITRSLGANFGQADCEISLDRFGGWYDLLVTAAEDSTFAYRLVGYVETGRDSVSDPAMGGLLTLKV